MRIGDIFARTVKPPAPAPKRPGRKDLIVPLLAAAALGVASMRHPFAVRVEPGEVLAKFTGDQKTGIAKPGWAFMLPVHQYGVRVPTDARELRTAAIAMSSDGIPVKLNRAGVTFRIRGADAHRVLALFGSKRDYFGLATLDTAALRAQIEAETQHALTDAVATLDGFTLVQQPQDVATLAERALAERLATWGVELVRFEAPRWRLGAAFEAQVSAQAAAERASEAAQTQAKNTKIELEKARESATTAFESRRRSLEVGHAAALIQAEEAFKVALADARLYAARRPAEAQGDRAELEAEAKALAVDGTLRAQATVMAVEGLSDQAAAERVLDRVIAERILPLIAGAADALSTLEDEGPIEDEEAPEDEAEPEPEPSPEPTP